MPARILVVEDNATNLELMVYLLQAFGFTTATAANGQEALDLLQGTPVDLVVCDLEMPVMDGYSLARRLRGAREYQVIPLIAVSAYAMVGDREKVLAAGFDGYLSKPIDPETFVDSVQAYLPPGLRTLPPPAIEQPSAPSVPLPPAVATVLVLDDSRTNLALMRSTLEPSGYEVLSAANVSEAKTLAQESRPDLIICDLHLPAESGLDFLRWLKRHPQLAAVPVLVTTASSKDSFDGPAALQAGAARFLNRPLDPQDLLTEVKAELQTRAIEPRP